MRKSFPNRTRLSIAFAAIFFARVVLPISAAELIVRKTQDAGPDSLRDAILRANSSPGRDSILFQITEPPPYVIPLRSALPTITDSVNIDADPDEFTSARDIELDGTNAGPDTDGLYITAPNCFIRGLAIHDFSEHAIALENSSNTVIQGNYLGTDYAGNPRSNGGAGVAILDASGNLIGGVQPEQANLITGNDTGIFITGNGSFSNIVQGNFIGPDLGGINTLGNFRNGILIFDAPRNIIGGSVPGARNLIAANEQSGVYLYGAESKFNQVLGNFIGVDISGTAKLANAVDGVTIYSASENVIGGLAPGAANVISGNRERGIFINGEGASNNVVQGNHIGTDLSDSIPIGNGFNGVAIDNVPNNLIGGAISGARNIISANKQSGVAITGEGAISNRIQGNFIGTDGTGRLALSNVINGILISGAPRNIIGGTNAGNIISGNAQSGVLIVEPGANGNLLEGNFIGCDATGRRALGNGNLGVRIETAGNRVGRAGSAPNLISGNVKSGLYLFGSGATNNVVQGNFIGTDASGQNALPNGGGIGLDTSPGNLIGGTTTGARNVVSGNLESGTLPQRSEEFAKCNPGEFHWHQR